MVRVKICGITNIEDAVLAVEAGADALGFVFSPSPRQITPHDASHIIAALPPFVARVGVFVDEPLEKVKNLVAFCPLDLVQLHGQEGPEYCLEVAPRAIKAFRVQDESVLTLLPSYRVCAYLLDSFVSGLAGGTGQTFDWSIARRAGTLGPVILSGGLTPENVARAIREARPYAVDVSSGVEARPGKKDHHKLRAFIQAVRTAGV